MTPADKKALSDTLVETAETWGASPKILRDLFAELSAHYREVCEELDREHAALFPATQRATPIPGGYI